MLQYELKPQEMSILKLVLCFLIIISGTIGAVYFLWKIYWIAGVVVVVPVWVLLADLFVFRRRSIIWYLLDFFRYFLIFSGTAVIAWYLWKINWIIAVISILPIYLLLLNIIGFLTLPFYFIAPEWKDARKSLKKIKQFNNKVVKNGSK
jgi:hypothetical protein